MLAGVDDEEDGRAVKTIMNKASTATQAAERLLGYLEEFTVAQPRGRPPREVYELFVGRLSRGLLPSTLKSYVDTMSAYGIYPGACDQARERIRRSRLTNGIKRQDAERGVPERTTTSDFGVMRRLVEERQASDLDRDLEYRCLTYVQIATGGRPENLLQIQQLRVLREGLAAKWGRRKVRSPARASVMYSHEWSLVPPLDIRERLWYLREKPWLFVSSSNIASAMSAWMARRVKRLGMEVKVTSTVGRARMSTLLYKKYEASEMTSERFSDLMDHEPQMSRQRYQEAF